MPIGRIDGSRHSARGAMNRDHGLQHAKRLLVDSSLLVKQIARECGFADAVSLYQTFLRHEGMSPQRYRRSYR